MKAYELPADALREQQLALAMMDTMLTREPGLHRVESLRAVGLMQLGVIRVASAVNRRGTPAAKDACTQAKKDVAEGLKILAELEDAGVATPSSLTSGATVQESVRKCDR